MPLMGKCPLCKGTGRVPIVFPPGANPKAPQTNPDKGASKNCPRCGGTGILRLGDK